MIRRECLAQTLFSNEVELQNKLNDFTDYYNNHRVHSSLNGEEILQPIANIEKFN
jgi:transposase InsO family protein